MTLTYKLFYQPACHYVHADVLTAQSYFSAFDPYAEIDPVLAAGVVAVAIAVLVVEQISNSKETHTQFTRDANYLLDNIRKELVTCLEVMSSNPEQRNDVYQTLIERLSIEPARPES